MSSHKNFVADIAFIPKGVKIDRKMQVDGRSMHFVSCAEDGIVNIWDTKPVEKEMIKANPEFIWRPMVQFSLFRQDGSGEMGLSRILFHAK